MTTKKKKFYGMNVGSASMLLIFVVLCLVSFAALSLVIASADKSPGAPRFIMRHVIRQKALLPQSTRHLPPNMKRVPPRAITMPP